MKVFLFQLQFLDKDDLWEPLKKAAKSTTSSEVKVQLTIWIVDIAKVLMKKWENIKEKFLVNNVEVTKDLK